MALFKDMTKEEIALLNRNQTHHQREGQLYDLRIQGKTILKEIQSHYGKLKDREYDSDKDSPSGRKKEHYREKIREYKDKIKNLESKIKKMKPKRTVIEKKCIREIKRQIELYNYNIEKQIEVLKIIQAQEFPSKDDIVSTVQKYIEESLDSESESSSSSLSSDD
jgi:type IV secretory pathway VirB4 component